MCVRESERGKEREREATVAPAEALAPGDADDFFIAKLAEEVCWKRVCVCGCVWEREGESERERERERERARQGVRERGDGGARRSAGARGRRRLLHC